MYNKRIKFFVAAIALLLFACLLRLTQIQLLSSSYYLEKIAQLKERNSRSRQLRTVRGSILDRKGRMLATDEPRFQLLMSYRLTAALDRRVERAAMLAEAARNTANPNLYDLRKELDEERDHVHRLIEKCTHFGLEREDIEKKIEKFNDKMWNLRSFIAWVRKVRTPEILRKYDNNVNKVPLSQAINDLEKRFLDYDQRLLMVAKVDDIADMDETCSLLELNTHADILTAQLEFMDANGIEIRTAAQRYYPYESAAAQTIGWVGLAHGEKLPTEDKLASYLHGEVAGRRPGAEYVCEQMLRGKRGELVYDIDRRLISRTETQFGQDVALTIDIELQKRIEEYVTDCELNKTNCNAPTAAVVIDVQAGDILALVSVPVFNLNTIRSDYNRFRDDSNKPLMNRAIYKQYPPGSVIKPLILLAGLEENVITKHTVISCPAKHAPRGWPDCWLFKRYRWTCHDDKWTNHARNAIKGSCNIFFTRLAEMIEPHILQQWLFKLGYGRDILFPPAAVTDAEHYRNFRQAAGIISSANADETIRPTERRWFGMGQGNLRATPLQVANAMAAIARGGIYRPPRLFVSDANKPQFAPRNLNISTQTLDVIYDGMSAVVNEKGGTAYDQFAPSGLQPQGLKVYGKTGSTENPEHAWFGGFAHDSTGHALALAVVVEGGQHGSSDAAPIAVNIFQFCIDAGYIGTPTQTTELAMKDSQAQPIAQY